MYSGGTVTSNICCALVMPIAMQSLPGPLVKLPTPPPLTRLRLAIMFSPATGSSALRRTASGFPSHVASGYVYAEVHSVNQVDVGVPFLSIHDFVSRCPTTA